jgi:hypothetical protein
VLRAREERYALEAQRDLTAQLMGDPPPRPRALGAAVTGEPVWVTANTAFQVYLGAHYHPQPSLQAQR